MKKRETKIGGQALIEGVMMRGSTACVLAVRDEDGDIIIDSSRIKPRDKIKKIPILRGIFGFFSSLILGTQMLLRSAEMAFGEDEKPSKATTWLSVFFAMVIALGVFFFLPSLASEFFYNSVIKNVLLKSLVSGFLRIVLFIGYLFLVSLLKDMRRVFSYHGAEHKTINCFESGEDLTVSNIKKCSTRHNRCGTTFMFLVMIISIIVFVFVELALKNIISLDGYARSFAYMAIKFAFLPLVAGISYEVLFFLAKMPDNWVVKVLRAPGLGLQRLTTFEPDESMIEVALAAFNEVLKMDCDQSIATRPYDKITLNECYDECDKVLKQLNAEDVEADWMLIYVLNCRRSDLKGIKHMSIKDFKRLKGLLEMRKTQPLDYCLGLSSFCGYDIKVDKSVLIPRFETEVLAVSAVETINENKLKSVLDLCTGSGCISVVLAKQTEAKIVAADISDEALKVASSNLDGLGVKTVLSDLFSAFENEKFDLIVSNPPYIKSDEIDSLQFEVKCQPRLALDGGEDGLNFYRKIALKAGEHLTNGGIIMLEVGKGQHDDVGKILLDSGFKTIKIINDLSGVERIIKASM